MTSNAPINPFGDAPFSGNPLGDGSSVITSAAEGPTDILLIDDDPLVVESLQRLLKKRGYRVATAYDANTGIEKAMQLTPAVIVCDLLLPGGPSGLEMCRHIKQNEKLSTIAFLIMTGHTDIANRVEAL
ncbi:MAG: response regulator, partial [Phormidesmis sp.]